LRSLERWSVALSFGCGVAWALAGCSKGNAADEPVDEEGVDIPARKPTESTPRSDAEAPVASEPDDPEPITGPAVVVPPVDRTVANGTSPRGGRCSVNLDCVPGLTCFTTIGQSTAGFESIAGGYCSTVCYGDEDCASVGQGSFCHKGIYGIPAGFCTEPCVSGAPEAEKCHGRTDLVCYANAGSGEVGSCNPTCGSDEQCGGAFCGFGTGQCRSAPLDPDGYAVGDACPAGEPVTCHGFCITATDQDGICTGPCRLGSACGNDPMARCVPSDPALRPGDFGLCEHACTTSADCTPGVAACAPTGFVTAQGQPERTCAYTLSAPSGLNQRLSVEELASFMTRTNVPTALIGVQAFTPASTVFHLSGSSDGICVTGTLASDSPVVLVFQLGSNDGVPFDASTFSELVIEHDTTVGLQAQLSNHPGVFYRNEVAEGISFALPSGTSTVPFTDMAPFTAGQPAWDPAQLEAVRMVIGQNEAGPLQACVQSLGFE
jgi:hypothetical protein